MNLNTKTLVKFVLLLQMLHFIFMHVWEWACKCYILGALSTEHTKSETLRNTRSLSFPPWWCHLVTDRRCKAMQNQNLKLQLLKPINPKFNSLDPSSVSCPVFQSGKLSFQKQAPTQLVTKQSPHSNWGDIEVLPQSALLLALPPSAYSEFLHRQKQAD